jgi:hypothetical protein
LKERGLWHNPEQDGLVRYFKTSEREKVVERRGERLLFINSYKTLAMLEDKKTNCIVKTA